MGLFADIKSVFNRKDGEYHKKIEDTRKVINCIYPYEGLTFKQANKRYYWIHWVLKYKILVPILYIFHKIIGPKLDHKVPNTVYYKNIQNLNKAWNNSINTMSKYWNPSFKTHLTYKVVHDLIITMACNDTAVFEFLNVLTHEITKQQLKTWKNKPQICHLFYFGNQTYNPIYFAVQKICMEGKEPNDELVKKELSKSGFPNVSCEPVQDKVLHSNKS